MTEQLIPTTYDALRTEIVQILATGQERARQAVEREKARAFWEVGRLLHLHLKDYGERAAYGEQVVSQLSTDLEIDRRRLYEMLKVHRHFPIVRSIGQLTWTHYLKLLKVASGEDRDFYLRTAAKEGWSVRRLEEEIGANRLSLKERSSENDPKLEPVLLQARRGQLYTYRLVESLAPGGTVELVLDLGFALRRRMDLKEIEEPRPGMILRAEKRRNGYHFEEVEVVRDRLFTFVAVVERVVDGDTLLVEVDCGFDCRMEQRLRLRGIDSPERATAAGQHAQAFVEEELKRSPFVVVKTHRPDKYDRYLADVFYLAGEHDPQVVLERGIFLNRRLLQEGLASPFV
jgi:hypothetical protein